MFSDWRVFSNFRTKTGVQVMHANGQLAEASGVVDVGFLSNVLLVPKLKTNLISEGKLALSGWKTMTYNHVKEVYDHRWNKVMETVIQNEANPLCVVDPVYFPSTENVNRGDRVREYG